MKNGEIEEASILETIQQEIVQIKSNLPAPLGEDLWMTDIYVKGNRIYYVVKIDDEKGASEFTKVDIGLIREGCLKGLRGEQSVVSQKKKFIEEKIHFVYIYTDGEGKEICRVDIGPDELAKL